MHSICSGRNPAALGAIESRIKDIGSLPLGGKATLTKAARHRYSAAMTLDRRRIAVILCGLCSFLDLWATQSLLPMLAQQLDATPVAVSFTVSMPPLAIALVAPWTGILADVLGRKRVI